MADREIVVLIALDVGGAGFRQKEIVNILPRYLPLSSTTLHYYSRGYLPLSIY